MRQAVHIFLKDSRQLRVPIAISLAWTVVFAGTGVLPWFMEFRNDAWDQIQYVGQRLSTYVIPIGWALIVSLAVQTDALAGDRQFWLTRPYSRGSLALAKAMFVVAYVTLPMTLAQGTLVVLNDLPLSPSLIGLAFEHVLLTIVFVMPAAALAAMTGSMAQVALSLIVLVPAAMLVSDVGDPLMHWVWGTVATLGLGMVGGTVLLVQFRHRTTAQSRLIGLAGSLALASVLVALPWKTAFALQSRVGPTRNESLRASLVPLAKPAVRPPNQLIDRRLMDRRLHFRFAIAGLPADEYVQCQGVEVSVEATDGTRWQPALRVFPSYTGPSTGTEGCLVQLQPAESIRESLESRPVHVRASIYVTRLIRTQESRIEVGKAPKHFANLGVCAARELNQPNQIRVPGETLLHAECRRSFPASLMADADPYSPFPATLALHPVRIKRWSVSSTAPVVATQRLLENSFLRVDFNAPEVNLADFDFTK